MYTYITYKDRIFVGHLELRTYSGDFKPAAVTALQ